VSLTHKTLSRWSCGFDFGFAITLMGYQFGFSFDLTEWHLMAEHHEGVGYLVCLGPIALDILDATEYIDPAEKVIQDLRDTLDATNETVDELYVKIAACAQNETARLFIKYTQALEVIEKLRKKQGGKNVKGKSLSTNRTSRKS
jgi:hypothetical protein